MPKRGNSLFVCQQCGSSYSKWSGRCAECGEWNSLVEQTAPTVGGKVASGSALKPQTLDKIEGGSELQRLSSGFAELDTVLGGGFVPGSITLMAGEPGIGKSTILLQVAHRLAAAHKVLYVSGEESARQIKLRSDRLKFESKLLELATTVSSDDVATTIAGGHYDLVIVDSIQTLATANLTSAAGTVSQITQSAQLITNSAKSAGTAVVIVGHVTKEGTIAGPKVLEHLVDVVLNFEGDRYGGFKVVRSIKNRFGSTNESAIFEMDQSGLEPVANPSAELLKERQAGDGSVVLATIEGSRPLLVEVQALVHRTSFGYPKRTAVGFELNRLNLLIAMLSRRAGVKLDESDVYLNVVGGLRLNDRGADLAVCLAIISAALGKPLKDDLVVFGEVGLTGEVRHTNAADKRVQEAKKLGFKGAIGPKQSRGGAFITAVRTVQEASKFFAKS